MDMDIATPLPATINSAVSLAFGHNITVYDAFYVALAKETEFTFVTADSKLYERVNDLNFVKFIGDIE
jgi:predicted nucleic acid-binding protein